METPKLKLVPAKAGCDGCWYFENDIACPAEHKSYRFLDTDKCSLTGEDETAVAGIFVEDKDDVY